MPDWMTDTARISFAAARLSTFPGTEHFGQETARFADYLENVLQQHMDYFFPVQQPQEPQLHRGNPMRPRSMSKTPPPPVDIQKWVEEAQQLLAMPRQEEQIKKEASCENRSV